MTEPGRTVFPAAEFSRYAWKDPENFPMSWSSPARYPASPRWTPCRHPFAMSAIFLVALPNHAAVRGVGMPDFAAVKASALPADDPAGKGMEAACKQPDLFALFQLILYKVENLRVDDRRVAVRHIMQAGSFGKIRQMIGLICKTIYEDFSPLSLPHSIRLFSTGTPHRPVLPAR